MRTCESRTSRPATTRVMNRPQPRTLAAEQGLRVAQSSSGMLLQILPDNLGTTFDELAVLVAEPSLAMTVNINLADNLSVHPNGSNNLRFCFERTGKVAQIGVNIIDDNCLALADRGATDSLVQGNTSM